jgi:hypothetical protein
VEKKSLLLIANDIASDLYKLQVEEIRRLIAFGDKETAQEKKKQLLAFTPSAVFKEKRQMPFLEMYSGFVHLDFDKLNPDQLKTAFEIIENIPYTFLCFISPSGNGLKIFVEIDTEIENHDIAYQQVQKYYEEATGLKADPSCKDITRLCFMSFHPGLHKNIVNLKFHVQLQELLNQPIVHLQRNPVKEQISPNPIQDLNTDFLFNQQVQFTNQKQAYLNGNRNNYIYCLASNCNRIGIAEMDTVSLIKQNFDLPQLEIKKAVESAYRHHIAEHKKFQPLRSKDKELPDNVPLMPTIPVDIFHSIPDFLKQITEVATTDEERDILLLGSLVTLSVAFPKVIGKYADNQVNANLFIFISAKASAGKGILIHCRKLVSPIHKALREQALQLKQQYEVEMLEYNSNKNTDHTIEKPQKPPQKMLFIPANNSATGFLEILSDSDSKGIIFETEGDTLSKAFKSDYGDFSDGFRNAFQHEPISYYRRTDKEYVEIPRPSLSALLSGTPKQIQILIPNPENGLFSRFMFYVMNMTNSWKDVFASKTENGLENHFEQLGNNFYNLYQTLQSSCEIHFSLSEEQQLKFNDFFSKNQNLYISILEEDYISTVRRLGLTAFRIMMIFSALRMMETSEIPNDLVCNNVDFNNTLQIITILLKHGSHVFTQIAQEPYILKPKSRKERFLEELPYNFNRQTYVAIGLSLGIPDKTAQAYISQFVKAGILISPGYDQYLNSSATNPETFRD